MNRRLLAAAGFTVVAACAAQPGRNVPPDESTAITSGATGPTERELSADCGLEARFTHATRGDGDRDVLYDDDVLLFVSDYAVNTDGAPNSYHPDDPWGSNGLAINTICNGANVRTAEGELVDYSDCSRFVELFEEARDGGWTPENGPRVEFYGVATQGGSGDAAHTPCINHAPPYEGYLVSTTSLLADPDRDRCDQARYLNALELPFIIVPGNRDFSGRGVNTGDLAIVHHPATQRTIYAIVGDRGPSWGLGEGSVYIARTLRGVSENPRRRRDIYGFGVTGVVTVMLPQDRLDPPYTLSRINAAGEAALERFGGIDRIDACAAALEGR